MQRYHVSCGYVKIFLFLIYQDRRKYLFENGSCQSSNPVGAISRFVQRRAAAAVPRASGRAQQRHSPLPSRGCQVGPPSVAVRPPPGVSFVDVLGAAAPCCAPPRLRAGLVRGFGCPRPRGGCGGACRFGLAPSWFAFLGAVPSSPPNAPKRSRPPVGGCGLLPASTTRLNGRRFLAVRRVPCLRRASVPPAFCSCFLVVAGVVAGHRGRLRSHALLSCIQREELAAARGTPPQSRSAKGCVSCWLAWRKEKQRRKSPATIPACVVLYFGLCF